MNKKEAEAITGGLSSPSKMPGPAYSTPASACKTGARLAQIPGSVCHGCYALKGRYRFGNVQAAQARRLHALAHPQWVDAMVTLVGAEPYFRWHDSGDIQSVEHLRRICEVARRTPGTRHWLPTREKQILRAFLRAGHTLPPNLTVRVSAAMIDGPPPGGFFNTSTVVTDEAHVSCPSKSYGNTCGPCRACWDPQVQNVAYRHH